jgi:hypothetical protein
MSSKASKRTQKTKSESVEEPEKQTKVSKTKGGEKEHVADKHKAVDKVAVKASKHEKEVVETPDKEKKTRTKVPAKDSPKESVAETEVDDNPTTDGDLVQAGGKLKKDYRYFRIIDEETGKALGRYKGRNPKQAVGKAYSKLVKAYEKRGEKLPGKLPIHIRESTRTGNKKIYSYYASRKELSEPTVVTIKSKTGGLPKLVAHKYKNDIRKMPKEERKLNFMDTNEGVIKHNKKIVTNPRKKLSGSKTKQVTKKTNSKTKGKKATGGVKQTQSKTKGKK